MSNLKKDHDLCQGALPSQVHYTNKSVLRVVLRLRELHSMSSTENDGTFGTLACCKTRTRLHLPFGQRCQAAFCKQASAERRGKCAVFCHRRRGLYAFVRLLQHRGNGIKIATIPEAPLLSSEVNIELNFPPKLRGARSRLYRRRFLQVNTR